MGGFNLWTQTPLWGMGGESGQTEERVDILRINTINFEVDIVETHNRNATFFPRVGGNVGELLMYVE